MGRSRLGESLIASSMNGSKVDGLDALWELVAAEDTQKLEQELNELDKSIVDWKKSSTTMNLNNSFLNKSKLFLSTMGKSMILGGQSSLLSSRVDSALQQSCPFVSADEWASQLEALAKSMLANRKDGCDSRLPYFGPMVARQSWAKQCDYKFHIGHT